MSGIASEGGFVVASIDGRTRTVSTAGEQRGREICTRERVLQKCRQLMAIGILRPQPEEICTGLVTPEGVARHFATCSELYFAAVEDEWTRSIVLRWIMPNGPWPCADDVDHIFRAVFVGRPAPGGPR
jgi:hypothetical protein